MSTLTNTLSKFAFAAGLAQMQLEHENLSQEHRILFLKLEDAALEAMRLWPGGQVQPKVVQAIARRINLLVCKMRWKNTAIHPPLNFSLMQMTDLLENHIKDHERQVLVAKVGDALFKLHQAFPIAEEEEHGVISEGIVAADLWEQLVEV